MVTENKHWLFEGNIDVDGNRYESKATLETFAPTEKKALNNLKYRYAKENGIFPVNSVELSGKFTVVG